MKECQALPSGPGQAVPAALLVLGNSTKASAGLCTSGDFRISQRVHYWAACESLSMQERGVPTQVKLISNLKMFATRYLF